MNKPLTSQSLIVMSKIIGNETKTHLTRRVFPWALRDSNPRPPACKAGALNQLS